MRYSPDEQALIWLCACTDTDPRDRAALLRAVKRPAQLFERGENFFANVIKKRVNGVYKEDGAKCEVEIFLAQEEKKGRFCVTAASGSYPDSLKHISDPPLVLFCAGNGGLLNTRRFAIVGSRIIPPWAEATGRAIAQELSACFTVVTGLAEGGDGAAIAGALPSGNLMSVLPCGLNECYPAAHAQLKEKIRQKGLLVSEYPPDEKVKKYSFHARNRLLAGLCEGVLVLSAATRSGALITANRALEYGRDVFALPHNAGVRQGEGCNALIKQGAYLVTEAADILSCYGLNAAAPVHIALSETEEKVLAVLQDGELHVTQIADGAHIPVYEASATIAALEMKNLVVRAGANRYAALK